MERMGQIVKILRKSGVRPPYRTVFFVLAMLCWPRPAAAQADLNTLLVNFLRNLSAGTIQIGGVTSKVAVASDFSTAANTNLQAITGLTWTMPSGVALNMSFRCDLLYSQATAAVAVAFGIQDVTVAPTNLAALGVIATSTTAGTSGNLPTLTTTTATSVVSATPSATGTVFQAELSGWIEQPSNGSSSAVTIMVSTAAGADVVTVKRGSFCTVW